MGRIGRYFRHLIVGMVQGCLILAVIAAVIAVVASLIINHALPQGYSFDLTIAVIVKLILGIARNLKIIDHDDRFGEGLQNDFDFFP